MNVALRFSAVLGQLRGRVFGEGRLYQRLIPAIDACERQLADKSDDELRRLSSALQYRARSGEALARLLPEAFALVREAAKRTLGMRHFEVQLMGGMTLFHGGIAEMETGEGKTLVATLPLYLRALAGQGVHLATVNDYLAKRDAEWMRPVFQMLGMSVGVIQGQMSPDERRQAYACDVTYGTANEFGFDFLRDRLLKRELARQAGGLISAAQFTSDQQGKEAPVQRAPYFALVDEADNILIDDARTPLVISAQPGPAEERETACFCWSASVSGQFVEDEHFRYDHAKRRIDLNNAGRRLVRKLAKPPELTSVGLVDLYKHVERAIKVQRDFHHQQQYVIRDGEVVIVDESTGRLAEGRKWSDGIHQAVEAKEGVPVTVDAGHAARVTIQDFFLRYPYLAGMTGTAASSASEMRSVYKLPVVKIPTHRPSRRKRLPDRVFGTADAKWAAIVERVQELHAVGRPVLIGTRTIEKSQLLSRLLESAQVPHQVLNAHHLEQEAQIVAQAGQIGRVTVSTNMAGRGTDIKVPPESAELGGLYVICSELHDSARIDRQLVGRCARQGDPGAVEQFLALDDDVLLAGLGPQQAKRIKEVGRRSPGEVSGWQRRLMRAQQRVESAAFRDRKVLLHYERERNKVLRSMGQDPYLDSSGR